MDIELRSPTANFDILLSSGAPPSGSTRTIDFLCAVADNINSDEAASAVSSVDSSFNWGSSLVDD